MENILYYVSIKLEIKTYFLIEIILVYSKFLKVCVNDLEI